MVEHRQLQYFAAVAEELNFSRAADRLHMSQPPLSVAIRKLEREVGAELLTRTTREVRLTDAGAMFLVGARKILVELDYVVHATRRAAGGELGSLRLGFSAAARVETLPELARRFRARYPDVELFAEEMRNTNMIPALRTGAIDVAMCVCPEYGADIIADPVRSERLAALMPSAHPLANRSELRVEELSGEALMLVAREIAPRLHDTLVGACRRAGFEPALSRHSLNGVWELAVLRDLGLVSLAPESVALELPAGLAAVPVSDACIETALVSRAEERSPVIASLRAVARGLYPAPGANVRKLNPRLRAGLAAA
jgi:DNA-binding transcriptional LysR family regulator